MTKAPERIFMDPDIPFPECEKQYGCDVEYIRADLSDALVSAAYEDAANLHQSLWRETSAYKTDQMLKRTPTDAQAALDRMLAQAREDALREAGLIVSRAGHSFDAEILALISEGKTNG